MTAQRTGGPYPLVAVTPRPWLGLETLARLGGVHPDVVRRLVTLGLLDPLEAPPAPLRFAPHQLAVLGRVRRLRVGLALNYAALGVVLDLLEHIEQLEKALRTPHLGRSDVSWT